MFEINHKIGSTNLPHNHTIIQDPRTDGILTKMKSNLEPAGSDYKHILLRKLSLAVTSSLLFQFIILLFYIFVLTFSLTSPISTTLSFFYIFTSFSTWFYFIPFLAIVFAQSVICAKDYIVNTKYCSTRFQKFISVFSVHNVILLTLHVIVGLMSVWLFLALSESEYNSLIKVENGKCYFKENTFYLLLSGGWTGLYYFLKVYTSEKKILFPVAHQRKWLQFKSHLTTILKDSKSAAFWPSFHFFYIYLIFGSSFVNAIASFFGCNVEYGNNAVLIYTLNWFFSIVIYFYLNVMVFFYELFLTEPLEFPIVAESMSLKEAIRINIPIIQHLACLDFFLLTQYSQQRRVLLFSLSQPGGHPHNWNNLIENVLKIITEYTETLNRSTSSLLLPDKMKLQMTVEPSPVKVKPINFDKLRSMSNDMTIHNVTNPIFQERTVQAPEPKHPLKEKFDSFIITLKKKSGFNFIFDELPEANIQKCLGEGQVIMWITQALSCISVASLKEDRYGIVQKDLPVILNALVELKLSVEKLNRIPALSRKSQGLDDFNTKMKIGILNSIKRSLFILCSSFGPYLKDLNLKKEIMNQLHAFIPVKCY